MSIVLVPGGLNHALKVQLSHRWKLLKIGSCGIRKYEPLLNTPHIPKFVVKSVDCTPVVVDITSPPTVPSFF